MKILTTTTKTATQAAITTPAYFVQIDWPVIIRLSSRGNQVWNGHTWTGGRLGATHVSANGGSIELINTDLAYSAMVLNDGAADIACKIFAFYLDNPGVNDVSIVFDGAIDGAPSINKDKVTITLVETNRKTLYSPRRFIGQSSGFNHLSPNGKRINWGGQTYILEGR